MTAKMDFEMLQGDTGGTQDANSLLRVVFIRHEVLIGKLNFTR